MDAMGIKRKMVKRLENEILVLTEILRTHIEITSSDQTDISKMDYSRNTLEQAKFVLVEVISQITEKDPQEIQLIIDNNLS